MTADFADKAAAREHVWRTLREQRAAAFPFPIHGRIPNFRGAAEAARRLMAHPRLRRARRVKCNPDSPQRPLRQLLLEAGVEILLPTPRLRGGFRLLDPARIPASACAEAAGLAGAERWAESIPVRDLPQVDLIITGSVAVTRDGRRCGKGHGYGDLEYALLRDLGHPPVPVVTTVHPIQVLDRFPADAHDLPVHAIATPDELIEVADPPRPPSGIDWTALSDADLEAMPVLAGLHPGRT